MEVTIKNISDIVGKEVIQVYLQDVTASISRPVKELKLLKSSASSWRRKTVRFELTSEAFSFYNQQLEKGAGTGTSPSFVGTSSEDVDVFEVEVGGYV